MNLTMEERTGLSTKSMVYREARECVDKINANMNEIRHLVLDLYEREGWLALGYESWRACVVKEFKDKQSYLYYQLEAAKTERNISTIVEKPGEILESQLRPLTKLRNNPEAQREAWQKAVDTAPEGKVTASHVYKIVKEMSRSPDEKKNVSPDPECEYMTPTHALDFATIAISQLERINQKDPKRKDALLSVKAWIEKQLAMKG